jgi:hypothetical protein
MKKKIWSDPYPERQIYGKPHTLDIVCRVENLKEDLMKAYGTIFKDHPEMLQKTLEYLKDLPMMNSTSKKGHDGRVFYCSYQETTSDEGSSFQFKFSENIQEDFVRYAYYYGSVTTQPSLQTLTEKIGIYCKKDTVIYYLDYGHWLKHKYKQ